MKKTDLEKQSDLPNKYKSVGSRVRTQMGPIPLLMLFHYTFLSLKWNV